MHKKKRILIFSLAYYPSVGGAEVAVKNITDRISPEDILFEMVTLRLRADSPETEQIGNVLVHRIGRGTFFGKRWFQVAAFLKGSALHQAEPFDVLWGMMAHSGGIPAMLFKSRFPNAKYILTLQEGDPISHIKRMMFPVWPLFVRVFRKADVIQAISTYLGTWARDMGFRGPLHIIPNGVHIEIFSRRFPEAEVDVLKKKLGKGNGDIWLIHTGRFVRKNGLEDIVASLSILPGRYHIFFIGDEGQGKKKLEKFAREVGVSDRIHFHSYVPVEEIPKYLAVSDIFIRPSLSEGMGNSFVEAMAAGIPVIGTQEGGIADFLFDPDKNADKEPTGLAVNIHDPKGIARQCMRLTEDRMLRERIIHNARNMARAKYDWDLIAKDMKEKVFPMSTL